MHSLDIFLLQTARTHTGSHKEGDYINVSHSLCNHTVQAYLTWVFVCSQTSDNSLVVPDQDPSTTIVSMHYA